MYFHTFGGSALLHLLAAFPRLTLLFGISGVVAMTIAPHGPGRYAGTGRHLAQIDAEIRARQLLDEVAYERATRVASTMLEVGSHAEIEAAIEDVLRECGEGCTDLTTPVIIGNSELLRHVLVLRELDAAAKPRAAARKSVSSTPITRSFAEPVVQ
jgi:hypothetical protein